MSSLVPSLQAVGFSGKLMVTSRLDSCTQGVVILGKNKTFVAAFNALMRQESAVTKTYCALSARAPPLGMHISLSCHPQHSVCILERAHTKPFASCVPNAILLNETGDFL